MRLFHWLLVLAMSVALATGLVLPVNWLNLHLIAGTLIAVLLIARLVWGVTGTTYSRFSSFVTGPRAMLDHVQGILAGTAPREAGHNPLGAAMVIGLILVSAAIVISGAVLLGGAFKQGPFKSFFDFTTAWSLRDVHQILAYLVMAMIAAHIGGVIFESRRTGENLAFSMVSGLKRPGFAHAARPARAAMAVAGVLWVVMIGGGAAISYGLTQRAPLGVPAMAANAAWAEECSACHIAFHPSLLPEASWNAMMKDLSNHFGEDASLDPATTEDIRAFLVANSSEHWDTLPANRLRAVDPEKPLEITATAFWKRRHGEISAVAFSAKPVGAKQNCAACHADAATGLFAPQAIEIPEESEK